MRIHAGHLGLGDACLSTLEPVSLPNGVTLAPPSGSDCGPVFLGPGGIPSQNSSGGMLFAGKWQPGNKTVVGQGQDADNTPFSILADGSLVRHACYWPYPVVSSALSMKRADGNTWYLDPGCTSVQADPKAPGPPPPAGSPVGTQTVPSPNLPASAFGLTQAQMTALSTAPPVNAGAQPVQTPTAFSLTGWLQTASIGSVPNWILVVGLVAIGGFVYMRGR